MDVKKLVVDRKVFDLDSFDEVDLVKEIEFTPAASADEVLARKGGDASVILALLNSALEAEAVEAAYNDLSGFHTYKVNDDGEIQDDEKGNPIVNGPFTGSVARNMKDVKALILTLAKTVYGFKKGISLAEKKAAKEAAAEMIRNTPGIREGLKSK